MARKIIGGYNLDISDSPWQVALLKFHSHYCGASIVTSTWIISAGHCGAGEYSGDIKARAGSSFKNAGGQVVQVKNIIVHSQFDDDPPDFDVALFELETELEFGSTVSNVQLPPQGLVFPAGAQLLLTGYGRISDDIKGTRLKAFVVSMLNWRECQRIFYDVTSRMLCLKGERNHGGLFSYFVSCFIYKNKNILGSCFGDSGSPLVLQGTNVLVGIVSWHNGKCSDSTPKMITNVAYFTEWILMMTRKLDHIK